MKNLFHGKKGLITGLIVLLMVFQCVTGLFGANPLVTNVRTADGSPIVYNNRFYIVCGQDEVSTSSFNMYAWRLLSSTNMRDWTDHGQILRPDSVSWMPNNRAWASDIRYANGYFYFYASNDWQIGVMRGSSITGPWTDVNGDAMIDSSTPGHAARDIDPMCYIDNGTPYLFWGGDGNCRRVRLNSNMTSMATSISDVPGLSSYLEAPFIVYENSTYFLMYADAPWPSEIRYATASSITGSWTYRGIIGRPTGSGTNHEGAAYYGGQWWYTYHTEELSNNNPYSRCVCVDKMYFNGSSIQQVTYTDDNGGGLDGPTPTPSPTPPPVGDDLIWSGGPYTLNGSSDYVNLPDGVVDECTDFTVATWVNLDTIDTWERIFDFGNSTSVNMFLTAEASSGNLRYAITTGGSGGEQQLDGSSLSTGSWQHVAVTLSGNTGRLYRNGSQVASNSNMTLSPYDLGTTTNNYIGRSQYSDPYLDGQVDDFRIYNYALTSTAIANLAANPPGGDPTPTPGPTPTPPPGGQVTLTFRYALGNSDRTGSLIVNGNSQNITFSGTGAWDSWSNHNVNVTLNGGTSNTIRLESTGQDLANIDQLSVSVGGTYQAEDHSYGGGVSLDNNHSGYNGTGFLNFPSSGGYNQFNNVNGG